MKTRITLSAYHQMIRSVGSRPAESGGLLFGSREDWVVTKFLFDRDAETSKTTYSFNVGYLNLMIEKLGEEGLQLLGFFHSHPSYCRELSMADREYFQSQFKNIPVDRFLTPLMFPAVDGVYDFIPYIYHKDGRVEQTPLEILPDDYTITRALDIEVSEPQQILPIQEKRWFTFRTYLLVLVYTLLTGVLLFIIGGLYIIYGNLETLLNL